MSVATDRTAEILAALPAPTAPRDREPNDYGRDTLCVESLQTGRYAIGTGLIGQRIFHRLITQQGTLRGSRTLRDFGLDLPGMIGQVGESRAMQAALGPRIEVECRKDLEVQSVQTTLRRVGTGKLLEWEIILDVRSTAGPFELVIGVDEGLNATLLKLEDKST